MIWYEACGTIKQPLFFYAFSSEKHWPLLISEALASVVALYAGKVRVAWTIQTHDDLGVVVWFVSFCLVLMLSGRSGSTLFP